jgi:hypothetical protein
MRRWGIVSCLILIVAFALSAPAAAQALTVSGGQLSSGSPVNTKISTVGQEIEYTFSATAGENVTFNVTNFNFTGNGSSPAFYLVFFEPGSNSQYTSCTFTGNNYCRFSPPQSGTWSILLEPVGTSVGSLTLTSANNVASITLGPRFAVGTTIKFEGQYAQYTFDATAGNSVAFDVTDFKFSGNGSSPAFYLVFFEPGSNSQYTSCTFAGNGSCDISPPQSGAWSILLEPVGTSVGSLTIEMA